MSESIGVGIITCNRLDFFKKCRESIKHEWYNYIVVVNDGGNIIHDAKAPVIQTSGMEGVGRAKNIAERVRIDVIKAHKKTGIHHLMFAYHGPANKAGISKGKPAPRKIIDYGDVKIALNQHCVGAVCFYTKECLNDVGLYDETYTNAFEHVDHSYELAKKNYSTPYWWWADIANSLDFVEEQACSEDSSAIRPRRDWQSNIKEAWEKFTDKHGVGPTSVLDTDPQEVVNILKQIKNENRSK